MADHFNKLSPEVAELLAILSEECAEVIQVVSKILRHGIRQNPYTGAMNVLTLEGEMTDLMTVTMLLDDLKVIDLPRISAGIGDKIERMRRPDILHHSSFLRPFPCVECGSTTEIQTGGEFGSVCFDSESCHGRQA